MKCVITLSSFFSLLLYFVVSGLSSMHYCRVLTSEEHTSEELVYIPWDVRFHFYFYLQIELEAILKEGHYYYGRRCREVNIDAITFREGICGNS